CQDVQPLAAQDAMLAVLRLQVAVLAEGVNGDLGGQGVAEVGAVATKARIEDRHLDPAAAVTELVPAIHAQLVQDLRPLPGGVSIRANQTVRRGFLDSMKRIAWPDLGREHAQNSPKQGEREETTAGQKRPAAKTT